MKVFAESKNASLKKIIHIDMDCFYAAVEMRDFPELKNKPIGIGGGDRGVLSTANYEARKYGVKSAMPTAKALKLCPHLILRPHRFDRYREASNKVREIFNRYTSYVEPLSLDEAYLDVSQSLLFKGSASLLAQQIKKEILEETQLVASAGIAPNKFLAKIASDWNKPDGLFTIKPEDIDNFIKDLDVAKIFGVGKKSLEHLRRWNIQTCADLQKWSKLDLEKEFGPSSISLYNYCRGIDEREVVNARVRKSLSVETTFSADCDFSNANLNLAALYEELQVRLKSSSSINTLKIKTLFVKIKTQDFKVYSLDHATSELPDLSCLSLFFQKLYLRHDKKIRLLGIGLRFEEPDSLRSLQENLF